MNEGTRFGSIQQEIVDFKNEFSTLISSYKKEIHQKFETMNNRHNTMENSIKTVMLDQVSDSKMKVKDSVIEAIKEDNLRMQRATLTKQTASK